MNNKKPTGETQTDNAKIIINNRVKKAISTRKVTRSARPIRSLVKMKSVRPMVVGFNYSKSEQTED
jgi:hypothetical protein